eukprot:GGOE01034340.1.p1 GENE.GGOE01034340.1~~GGOE01034340.1.p1  ORF type:complete len:925 (+),score=137.32 GGOE01034340.1:33-2807(+)
MKLLHFFSFMLILHLGTAGSLGMGFYPLDKFGNSLLVAGAQPSAIGLVMMTVGSNLKAGDTITFSATASLFKVPTGTYSLRVSTSTGVGSDCTLSFTRGTTTSMTWTLDFLNGACDLQSYNQFYFIIPQAFAQVNPKAGYQYVYASATGTSQTSNGIQYSAYAAIYATADPRSSDDSSSELTGGKQPSFMNIGFTVTWNVASGAVIQLSSSPTVFRRPSQVFAIPISGTGCTATLSSASTGSGTTSTLKFTLSGSSCQITANVPVGDSQFQLPSTVLTTNPVETTVSITVTLIVGSATYAVSNGNPGAYTTANGCSSWSSWSSCSTTCGTGYTYRTRTGDSATCPSTISTRSCNTIACGCKAWSSWGSCSATCGGTISRYRTGSRSCNVATTDTQTCGPTCNCPWKQTACSSSCGSGVRTRTITPKFSWVNCGTLKYDVVCNETFTTESLACPCVDTPWVDRFGSTCADYVKNNWCTSSGDYGTGWDFTQPGFRNFDYRTNNNQNALSACCGCGKNKCVKDTVLLIDQSASIALSDWYKIKQYITDRVNQTVFTNEYGNRFAIVQFDVASSVLCPMTWNQTFLLNCIDGITFPAGGGTATSAGLNLAYTVFDRYSSPNRTRVVEMLTDGSPNIPNGEADAEAAAFASAYMLKDAGVTIVTLGMGVACATSTSTDCLNRDVLNTMASEPSSSYAVLLSSYDSLSAMALFISSQCTAQIAGFDPSPSPIPEFSPDPSSSPSPAASPLPSPSTSPKASPSPKPSASTSPAASPSPKPSASPSPAVSASPKPSASPSPGASASPKSSASPRASASPWPSTSPWASASPWPSASPWASASPLQSPNASPSPFASPSPDGREICKAQEALVPSDWLQQNVQGCDRDGVASLLRQYQCVELQPKCGTFQCSLHVPPSVILHIQTNCNSLTP